jgi:hypothetical protein
MDLVIRNARIHTVDPALPEAEAVAVEGGRIAWVGPDRQAPNAAEVVDAGGATVLPGFVDAHNHVRLGSDAAGAQLAGASSLGEVGRRIAAWSAENPDADWIEAEGLDYTALPGHSGTASDLDRLTDGRPAAVLSYDVHTLWLNTAALERLGIDRDHTSLPFGVAAVEDGEPTGFVHDFAVRGLSRAGMAGLRALGLPWAGLDRQYARLVDSLDRAARSGITTVVEPQNSVDDLALFRRARAEGRLRSRLVAALFHPRGTTAADLQEFAEVARAYDDDLLRVGPLKLYIDDVIEPRTAAMLEPYEGQPDNVGRTYYEPDEFADVVTGLDAAGFQLFVHATGDRGIRTVLDAIQQARRRNGPALQPRHRRPRPRLGRSGRRAALEQGLADAQPAPGRCDPGVLQRLERRRDGPAARDLLGRHPEGTRRRARLDAGGDRGPGDGGAGVHLGQRLRQLLRARPRHRHRRQVRRPHAAVG